MHRTLLDILACPACRSDLSCEAYELTSDDNITRGSLHCISCLKEYPITDGIPRFVETDNYASSFGFQWNLFREEQIDSSNGIAQSERRFRTETGWSPESLNGAWVLDPGCGAGRFLEVASRSSAQVVGVDISSAVDAARLTLGDRANVHLVQASIFELPFRDSVFDACYCIGVIQHTPDPIRAVRALPPMLKEGGRLALTIYERRAFTMLNGKYAARILARHLSDSKLLAVIRGIMPVAFPLTEVMFRIPVVGRLFQFVIPVANYVHDPELSWKARYQWALMDTFDMLSPAFDSPQRETEVSAALNQERMIDIRRLRNPGLNVVACKAAP